MKETTMSNHPGLTCRFRSTRVAAVAIAMACAVMGLAGPSFVGAAQPTVSPPPGAAAGGDQGRKLVISVLESQCDALLTKSKTVDKTGKAVEFYDAPSSKLHKCLYVVDMRKTGCVARGNCQSFADWSASHPGLNPDLPRAAFLEALEGHRGAPSGATKPTGQANTGQ